MNLRRLIIILLVCSVSFSSKGQDEIFSQFFAAPIQLNPALTGTTYSPRITLNYRNQWPALPNAFITYAASYDQYLDHLSSGFGFSVLSDNAGDGILRTTKLMASYAYNLQLNESFFIRGGLEGGLVQRRLNWDKLIFLDQIDPLSGPLDINGIPFPSLETRPDKLTRNYFDLSAGLMAYSPWFYAGFTVKHINAPDDKFLSDGNTFGTIPSLLSIHAGAEINVGGAHNKRKYPAFISPNIIFAKQGDFHQLNAGAFASAGLFYGGAWFRHTFSNADAAIVMAGFRKGILRLAYSYDITVSGLSSKSGGAHEISVTLNFDESESSKIRRKSKRYNDCLKMFR